LMSSHWPLEVEGALRRGELGLADRVTRKIAARAYREVRNLSWMERFKLVDEATGGIGYVKNRLDESRMTTLGCLIAWPEAVKKGARVFEVGTGLGRTCHVVTWSSSPSLYLSVDVNPYVLAIALYDNLVPTYQRALWRHEVKLALIDARKAVKLLGQGFDHVVHDGGPNPDNNPELWSKEFLAELVGLLRPGGTMSVFAGRNPKWVDHIYRALRELGLRAWTQAAPGFKVRVVRAEKA